tara:strand:+ start:585 stop:839 length:255 start_codon:yes stop_codon:yes gene_type:complete
MGGSCRLLGRPALVDSFPHIGRKARDPRWCEFLIANGHYRPHRGRVIPAHGEKKREEGEKEMRREGKMRRRRDEKREKRENKKR